MCRHCKQFAANKTCNHITKDIRGSVVKIKIRDEKDRHSIIEMELCDTCIVWHAKNNLILRNKGEEEQWIKNEKIKSRT